MGFIFLLSYVFSKSVFPEPKCLTECHCLTLLQCKTATSPVRPGQVTLTETETESRLLPDVTRRGVPIQHLGNIFSYCITMQIFLKVFFIP